MTKPIKKDRPSLRTVFPGDKEPVAPKLLLKVEVEGKGKFKIPAHQLPWLLLYLRRHDPAFANLDYTEDPALNVPPQHS